jgi:hypothetical protein
MYLLIDIDYNPVVEVLATHGRRDLIAILPQHSTIESALPEFLTQFQETQRWNFFEPITLKLLSAAAQLQLDIMHNLSPIPSDLSGENTVIVLALRCLLLVHDIALIDAHMVYNTEDMLFSDGEPAVLLDAGFEFDSVIPTVLVHSRDQQIGLQLQIPPNKEREQASNSVHGLDYSFEDMVRSILRSSSRLLDTRDPRHWPTVLYVLLILALVQGSLQPQQPWMWRINKAMRSCLGRS